MRRVNVLFRSTARRLRQRGSALLASLMVIVGLSLLGLAFVAISETESSISNNQKNHSEAVAVAEAGGKLVVQWFQDPVRINSLGLLPPNTNALKTQRTVFVFTASTSDERSEVEVYVNGTYAVTFDTSNDHNVFFF